MARRCPSTSCARHARRLHGTAQGTADDTQTSWSNKHIYKEDEAIGRDRRAIERGSCSVHPRALSVPIEVPRGCAASGGGSSRTGGDERQLEYSASFNVFIFEAGRMILYRILAELARVLSNFECVSKQAECIPS